MSFCDALSVRLAAPPSREQGENSCFGPGVVLIVVVLGERMLPYGKFIIYSPTWDGHRRSRKPVSEAPHSGMYAFMHEILCVCVCVCVCVFSPATLTLPVEAVAVVLCCSGQRSPQRECLCGFSSSSFISPRNGQ